MAILLGITWVILGIAIFIYGIKNDNPVAGLGLILLFAGVIVLLA